MTRVIAGRYGGRQLHVPRGRGVRPTTDRVREAWMSIIGPALEGARVVDLFAGTGALGIEALSRGAAAVDFVESSPTALRVLRRNLSDLEIGVEGRVIRGDAIRYMGGLAAGAYDVALADPPYQRDYAGRLIARFRDAAFAGILVLEHPSSSVLAGDETRRYGDSSLTFCYAP